MLQLLAIGLGGAIGSLARFWLATGIYTWLGRDFPWGTLVVNLLGSFLIGFLAFFPR
jgi:fluoride exporter